MNEQYEFQIIGTYLMDLGLETMDVLSEDDFTYCKKTFRAIRQAADKQEKINPICIAKDSEFNLVELLGFINGAFPSLLESNIRALKKISLRKRYRQILDTPVEKDIFEHITDTIEKLQNLELYRAKNSIETKEACFEYMKELDKRKNEKGHEMHIGIEKFDKTTGGFHRKELTVIGARPSVGKSALALQIACELAIRKFKVLFISLEMSDIQIIERMMAKYSRVEHQKLRSGDLEMEDWQRIAIGTDEITKRNFILDTSVRTIGDLRAKAVMDRPDIIILDYIGLLKDTSEKWKDKRTEISSITRKLKLMTLDLNIPIIILAQLGRSAQNKEPILSELRDSGSLEEDADNVIFIHRLSVTEAEKESFGSFHQCEHHMRSGLYPSILMVEKHRNGATGFIRTMYTSGSFSFKQLANE